MTKLAEQDEQETLLAIAGRLLSSRPLPADCPAREVMDQVTTRWSTLIMAALVRQPHRFAALQAEVVGISGKMLSRNLKALVRAGLVHREVTELVPPQVTYSLTPMGAGLAGPLCQLVDWFAENADGILKSMGQYDAVGAALTH
jgi:DNA-binding HxlR family transcriptional regulator